jgi:polyisoprenyl-phosphate glycosyltransferase
MKLISIIIPCFNEEKNISELYNRIKKTFEPKKFGTIDYSYEIIFVDNASTDNSITLYKEIINSDDNVQVLVMARNTGTSQPSFLAGLKESSGDAVVMIESDLQDPPELIQEFIKKWENGFDVVYGIRTKRKENIIRRIFYTLFYRIFKWLSYITIPLDAGDFCLMDKKVVSVITSLPEKDVYIRGLRSWAGFNQTGIEYVREKRKHGKTSISFFRNFFWAKKAIVNFSDKPLEFISRIAIITTLLTFFAAGYYLYIHITTTTPQGFSTLIMFMFIFGSIQLLALGVIGEYLIRIFHEIKGRPPYIISKKITAKTKENND